MNTQHTPGEWFIDPERNPNEMIDKSFAISVESPEWCIAAVWKDLGDTEEEGEANARLIAAAPELLEALIFITEVANGKAKDKTKVIELRFERDTLLQWVKKANAAIQKATK